MCLTKLMEYLTFLRFFCAGRKKETGGLSRTPVSVGDVRLFCGLDRKCACSGGDSSTSLGMTKSLFQVTNHLVAVSSAVLPARDVNPVIFTIAGFHDQLIKVSVVFQPVEPLAGGLKDSMTLVVIPSRVRGKR